jgi:hypothetical protein
MTSQSLEKKMGIWCAGYDAAVKEILRLDLPEEIMQKIRPILDSPLMTKPPEKEAQ